MNPFSLEREQLFLSSRDGNEESIPIDQLNQDRSVERVRNSTSNLLVQFQKRLDLLRGNSEVSEKLLRSGFDPQVSFDEAIKFFGSDTVRYIAIDGTEFQEDKLDMLIFFAGAYAYGGLLQFKDTEIIANPPVSEKDFLGLSCAIPITAENSSKIAGDRTEGGIETDSSKVPQALMHFAEYYLAYTALKTDPDIKVLLLDRSVSGDIAHISWKMREFIQQDKIALVGIETPFGRVTRSDLELGRMLLENADLNLPPARSQYLKFAAMRLLMETHEELSTEQIIQRTGGNPQRRERLYEDLRKHFGDCFSQKVDGINSRLALKDSVTRYLDRLMYALDVVAKQVFNPGADSHPLNLEKIVGRERWISPNDLAYFTLITIYAILREAWNRNILVLGIVKDTEASELVSTVIPVLRQAGLLAFYSDLPSFGSDKMLLQTNSVVNSKVAKTPWSTFEYDVCFRTVSPVRETHLPLGECQVNGAFKNVITCERMFVKSYFQLWSSENDPAVRSHVFLYDRPCYPQYDMLQKPELVLRNEDVADETIVPAIHFVDRSPISDLIMGVLCSMGLEPIPEAIGHNYALFLADKKAKWLENEASKACIAAVELELARSRLDQEILYESKFRDYRTNLESSRRSKRKQRS